MKNKLTELEHNNQIRFNSLVEILGASRMKFELFKYDLRSENELLWSSHCDDILFNLEKEAERN